MRRLIIDTDPGVDDVLALLLAFNSPEVEVALVSLTYGNVQLEKVLHNAVSLFHVIERELAHRRAQGVSPGFASLLRTKPLLALGAVQPLADEPVDAGYFHGLDGLGNVHASHPHLSASDYAHLFEEEHVDSDERLFVPTREPAHLAMLRVLRDSAPGTVTVVAVGPLTNLALAVEADREAFLRAKEVVVMGGAVDEPGNVTPFAEFNVFADPLAASQVLALTASSTLRLLLCPLDLTHAHNLTPAAFPKLPDSPLGQLVSTVVGHTFATLRRLSLKRLGETDAAVEMSLHDPVCVWYALFAEDEQWSADVRDVRVETAGRYTRGMTVVDRRQYSTDNVQVESSELGEDEDRDGWRRGGNRVVVLKAPPPGHPLSSLPDLLLQRLFPVLLTRDRVEEAVP